MSLKKTGSRTTKKIMKIKYMRVTLNHLHSHLLEIKADLQTIKTELHHLKKQNNKTMATLQEVKQSLTDLQESVDANQEKVIAKIQELKDQIGSGSAVTEADLDDLVTTVKGIQTDVDTTEEG